MNLAVETRPRGPRRLMALATQALRSIGWTQIRAAMLFGVAVSAVSTVMFIRPIVHFSAIVFLGGAIVDQIMAFCLMVAIVVADRAVDAGAPRRSAYIAAAVGGCVLGVLLSEPVHAAWRTWVLPAGWGGKRPWLHGTASFVYYPIFMFTHWLLIGGSAVFLYAHQRAARKTAARLRDAELDRVRRSKFALESRLQAMQARIEPQFLFNTLAQVEKLYEHDAVLADRMLDELIAYLRAAMPLMRDTASTLGQEIELVRAYLGIVRLRLGERLAFEIESPAQIAGTRMPPMMLLPLVDHAIAHGLAAPRAGGELRIRTDVVGTTVRLEIADSGAGLLPGTEGDGIDAIRERLTALYGDAASLTLRGCADEASEAVLQFPLESAGPDRPDA